MRITWRTPLKRFWLSTLRMEPENLHFNKSLRDADAAGPRTSLWEPLTSREAGRGPSEKEQVLISQRLGVWTSYSLRIWWKPWAASWKGGSAVTDSAWPTGPLGGLAPGEDCCAQTCRTTASLLSRGQPTSQTPTRGLLLWHPDTFASPQTRGLSPRRTRHLGSGFRPSWPQPTVDLCLYLYGNVYVKKKVKQKLSKQYSAWLWEAL